jgi:hypothetical protein
MRASPRTGVALTQDRVSVLLAEEGVMTIGVPSTWTCCSSSSPDPRSKPSPFHSRCVPSLREDTSDGFFRSQTHSAIQENSDRSSHAGPMVQQDTRKPQSDIAASATKLRSMKESVSLS